MPIVYVFLGENNLDTLVYIVVNLIGVGLIVFVIGWFWLAKKSQAVTAVNQVVEITVADGVYQPDRIAATVNQNITLRFTRLDEAPCAATVVFADFNKSLELPIKQAVDLKIMPTQTGEFEFTCQMGMYRGHLVVAD